VPTDPFAALESDLMYLPEVAMSSLAAVSDPT